jgi:hypothetical protein
MTVNGGETEDAPFWRERDAEARTVGQVTFGPVARSDRWE